MFYTFTKKSFNYFYKMEDNKSNLKSLLKSFNSFINLIESGFLKDNIAFNLI